MYDKRIVVKVGTNVMINKDNRIVQPILKRLVDQVAELYEQNIMTVLVSSGSANAGREILGESDIENKSIRRQVYSAIGQPRMMRYYYSIFHDYGMRCAQVLATKRDFNPGEHRKNMINCYEGLMSEGVIPIANEDDAVSVTHSMFSDNDELASLIAELIHADMLIILTDIDGFYTGHPDNDDSELLPEVRVNQKVEQFIEETDKGETSGRGGMGSKLKIAKNTAAKNIPTYIANGKKDRVILDIVAGKDVGTRIVE
ncbi:glutamate 5-kinase [Sinomicrobium kalidii]|uniref:glutamate 5-kinase n=1 Tax=Sinomicrobium kalidii TaxID=2900738 RepID=UPI001E537B66|nr:glutamate 5-kinase [Sinomicrobium kalidii]UGU17013.1 glutamate 5-kinase [Sinomicrobium kalidii]